MEPPKLLTLVEYNALTPFQQGYIHYMQAGWPKSELKGLSNPYVLDTPEYKKWNEGQTRACLDVQDGEE